MSDKPEMYFKVLAAGGRCVFGSATYSLPTQAEDGSWVPGEWMPSVEGELVPCHNGYHLCRIEDLIHWLNEEIYEAEYRGDRVDSDDKIVVREVRLLRRLPWDKRTAVTFAADCAEHVLHLFTAKFPDDNRPAQAIKAARDWVEAAS